MRAESPWLSLPDRDVVVSPDGTEPARWSVRQAPGVPQLVYTSKDAAIAMARRFADRERVSVWYCEGQRCTLLLDGHTVDI